MGLRNNPLAVMSLALAGLVFLPQLATPAAAGTPREVTKSAADAPESSRPPAATNSVGAGIAKTTDVIGEPSQSVDGAVQAERKTLADPGDDDDARILAEGVAENVQKELIESTPQASRSRAAAPLRGGSTRRTLVRGADATVMLAATIDDAKQGTLEPIHGHDGAVLRWKIRAADASDYFRICEDDPAAAGFDEPTVGNCTGVFVGPDLVLTASHCIDAVDSVSNLRVVLDYGAETGGPPAQLPKETVRRVVLDSRSHDPNRDWALLRIVDGEFPDRVVPLCRPTDHCGGDGGIWSIGHPLGVSRRFLSHHRVVRRSDSHVLTDLDTYVGSSGSPVYDREAQRVLGIVVSGRPDFVSTRTGCRRFANMHRAGAKRVGEVVLLVDALPTSLLRRILPWQSSSRRVTRL